MVVRKILEATLVAGSSSVTFTDSDIPNSLLRVYSTKSALFPISQTLSGNSVTVNYKPQDSNVGVALEIVKSGLDIVDDLESEDATKALSANQGYVLKGLIDGIVIPTVPENITDLDDVEVNDITNNQVLAWDAIDSKFKNVDQSGGGGEVYSDQETVVGTFTLEGVTKPVYRKVVKYTGTFYGATSVSLNTGLTNVSEILPTTCINAIHSANTPMPLPYCHYNNNNNIGYFISDDFTKLNLRMGTSYTSSSYIKQIIAVYEYTKTV